MELPFAKKPKRIKSKKALAEYRRERPFCELLICGRSACPEPHHIITRQRGDDAPPNLVSLCNNHHREYHNLGGRAFYRKYAPNMLADLRAKILRALRLEG